MRSFTQKILGWITYPILMSVAVCAPAIAITHGYGVSTTLIFCVLVVTGSVAVLEYINPADSTRRPRWYDWFNDSLFMFSVQLILPKIVTALFILSLARSVGGSEQQGVFWPHHWPVLSQALLMLVSADLCRYWLHRVSHSLPMLWSVHVVHHSPRVLYWANVGRFHPLDKVLQMMLDTLPFIWLGVNESVFAVYFVIYATNGFLQHSNIYLRHGVLNYVFSTAELHRWHHAQNPQTAQCNFGNNLSVWDLLFGTWCLPARVPAPAPGIRTSDYPMDFLGQLVIPFQKTRPVTTKASPSTLEKSV